MAHKVSVSRLGTTNILAFLTPFYANEFINTMSQRPFEKKLLPISSIETEEEQAALIKKFIAHIFDIHV